MSTVQTPKWLEDVKEASPLFGDYLQEVLACKLARVLPNNCVLLEDDKVSSSLLIVERICENIYYCPQCDDCSLLNMKPDFQNVQKDHCLHIFVANILIGKQSLERFKIAPKCNLVVDMVVIQVHVLF